MINIKGLFNDNESDVDYIGYSNYISAFKYIIDNDEDLIEPPIVFGLHGDWGIGKSTFMNLLDKELEKNKLNITIRINPWEYKDSNDIVSLFFVELYKKLKKKSLVENFKDGFDRIFELIYPLKIKFNAGMAGFEYDITKIKEIEKVNILDNYVNENHLRKENIKNLFNKTFLVNYRIIVFIDDLDRCSVDKVINILESVKLFLNTNKCIFFLGCDVNYLNSAVANYYEKFIKFNVDVLDNSNENSSIFQERSSVNKFTKEYLEKIIQVPFHIPSIDKDSMETYIEAILNGEPSRNDMMNEYIELLKREGNNFKEVIPKKFVKELFSKRTINPRRIKRILNIIYLNYLFLITKTGKITLNDINLLVLLAIINDENHEFYEDKLSSKEVCIETFCEIYTVVRKSEDLTDECGSNGKNSVIESLLDVFFNYANINSKEDIGKYLCNISNILTVSNTTHISTEYTNKWGRFGEIESVNKTQRKLRYFLNNIDDALALDFCIWYFKVIFLKQYDRGKLQIGIYNNCNLLIFKSENFEVTDFSNDYLIKFSYDSSNKYMRLILDTGKYKSKLNRKIIEEKEILINANNLEHIKKKLIEAFGEEE